MVPHLFNMIGCGKLQNLGAMGAEPTMFMMAKDLLSTIHFSPYTIFLKTKELRKAHIAEYELRNPRCV